MDYSKFKDRKPEDTVLEIQRILNEVGLFPVISWGDKSYEGARSCRITLYPTEYGTNGKGTDELYATASGYGELIERLENNIITYRDRGDDMKEKVGFREFPDEKDVSVFDIADHPDPYSAVMFEKMGLLDYFARVRFLRELSRLYNRTDNKITVVPFADPVEGKIQWLPISFIIEFTLSNGMAAGNTMEEAMVQGLSEVFERAANLAILKGEVVPPVIPEEELKKYSFYRLIEQIHAEGHFRVTPFDCSMGRGWPVAGLMITDVKTGNFGIKLGAHPSFAIAMERTLTESLQGRNMEDFANAARPGTVEQSSNYHNITNVSKTGNGYYPAKLLTDKPDWEYTPWNQWEGKNNHEFLKEMFRLLYAEGCHPMVRDCSFLGFPSCFIVVPGVTEIYVDGKIKYKDIVTTRKARRSWDHFPILDKDEEKRLLMLILFNENSIRDNVVNFATARQLSEKYRLEKVAAWIALKHKEYDRALHFFEKLYLTEGDENEKIYYKAMVQYVRALSSGFDDNKAKILIGKLYPDTIASCLAEDVSDPETVMERRFPRLNCYDCANCPLAGKDCAYPDTREIVIKVMRAMKTENVSQEKLLKILSKF